MFSRTVLLFGQRTKAFAIFSPRAIQTTTVASAAAPGVTKSNLPRPVRLTEPGKVRMGLFPEEWFQFFYPKTGVTGPYMFGFGLFTYLSSKEIYVMEHDYYTGLAITVLCYFVVQNVGPIVRDFADKEIENYEGSWSEGREAQLKSLEGAIKGEEHSQWQAEGQKVLIQAKRENVALQLEAAYRERLMTVYQEVKRRLDFQIEKQLVEQRISQKHMVTWVTSQVLKSVTSEQDKKTLDTCINNLALLAKNVQP